jgi:hypothetical protein
MDHSGTRSCNVWPYITPTGSQDSAYSLEFSSGRPIIEEFKDVIDVFKELLVFIKMIPKLSSERRVKKFYSLVKHNYSLVSQTLTYHPVDARDQVRRHLRYNAIRLAEF